MTTMEEDLAVDMEMVVNNQMRNNLLSKWSRVAIDYLHRSQVDAK